VAAVMPASCQRRGMRNRNPRSEEPGWQNMSTMDRGFINSEMIASRTWMVGDSLLGIFGGIASSGGLSQEKLAVDAQIDRTYASSLERGHENPTVSVLDKLAVALAIPIADFFECRRGANVPQSRCPGGRRAKSE